MNKHYDKKFEKRINHLSSFVGMPMWNGRNPSLSEIREYDRRILEQQAKGFQSKRVPLVKRIYSWAITVISKTFTQVEEANKRPNKKAKKKTNQITGKIKAPITTVPECCS